MDNKYKTSPVHMAFANQNIMYDELPILDLGNRSGHTDYIDFITTQEMSSSIMRGIDVYKRPFIAFKVKVIDANNVEQEMVSTFFQRYTDDIYNWAYGTCYNTNTLYHNSRIHDYEYEMLTSRLCKLISGIPIKNIEYSKNDIDYENGNGKYTIILA